jgi:murein DD-endopeptidase
MISQSAVLIRRLACVLLLASLAAGCASQGSTRASVGNSAARQATNIAVDQIGVPYRYGGATPSGFDCSGLVHYSYAKAGLQVPRTTGAQWTDLQPVSKGDLQAGDILFFKISGKISHVGMYVRDGKFVHAPSSGRKVSLESLKSDFYADAFVRAGRPY